MRLIMHYDAEVLSHERRTTHLAFAYKFYKYNAIEIQERQHGNEIKFAEDSSHQTNYYEQQYSDYKYMVQ